MIKFRDLTADDIEVRIQGIYSGGLTLLLYKNARVDMAILDDTVGAENWQREHYECKGNLFCRVGINTNFLLGHEYGTNWVYKSDCGTESNTEKEKGESSDSFKRACFNWGIGRELYTSPFIWIDESNYTNKDGKVKDRFSVEYIEIKDKRIVALTIRNDTKRCIVFEYTEKKAKSEPEHICADCGKEIKSAKTKRGNVWNSNDIAGYSEIRYGRKLCPDCQKEEEKALKEGVTNESDTTRENH